MKHLVLILTALLFSTAANAQIAKNDVVGEMAVVPLTIKTEGGTHKFMVEEAKTLRQQARGMMWRETMGEDTGMIFEFDKPKVATIYMKNTAIPLDILFVRSNGKVLKIEHSHQPYTMRSASSEGAVAAVLELKGGRSKQLGIRPGDQIDHPFFKK